MDELTLLKEAAPEVAPPTTEALRAGRARLAAAARPRRSRRPLALGAAVAAAAVAITVVPYADPGPTPAASAAAVLRDAAATAAAEPDVRPGQFRYVKSLTQRRHPRLGPSGIVCAESWYPADGAPVTLPVHIAPNSVPGGCGSALPKPAERSMLVYEGPPAHPRAHDLPTAPAALRARLYREAAKGPRAWGEDPGTPADQLVFVFAERLLEESAPSALRAALYRVLAEVPGVRLVRNVRDLAGRPGDAVTRTWGAERQEIILDRATHRYLGGRQVFVKPRGDWRPGDQSAVAQIRTAIVGKAYQRP
ncbi:CU044_5270 family protein [Actinomadura macrotermitis]|uniref:CU044_5270 family protein n=1 Tax=Actinomadura macrotermitis TaxID=2585200 RepID=A0A7K0C3Y0_9ACTN|nr:CU044_5270 family protein [Actinomadura macrotermitis]MQY08167.1 hypothetical protein [Actinomadura macrotermitis]